MFKFGLQRAAAGAALGIAAAVAMPAGTAYALPDCGSDGQLYEYGPTGSYLNCEITRTGTYMLLAYGANGGAQVIDETAHLSGGIGAGIAGTFQLNAGDFLRVLIGINGAQHAGEWKSEEIYAGGGGGGTFVALVRGGNDDGVPLLVAGGGGGAGTSSKGLDGRGLEGSPGAGTGDGQYGNGGTGGTNGAGGGAGQTATGGAGGGGYYGDGGGSGSATGGLSFMDGGTGGEAKTAFCFGASGGFGGGGAAAWADCTEDGGPGGGGGGGWSGGGGGWEFWGNDGGAGGGGSSYYNPAYATGLVYVEAGGNPYAEGMGQFRIMLQDDSNDVPEPGMMAILGVALGVLGWQRRRQRPGA